MKNEGFYTRAEAAKAILSIGRRMYQKNFVAANDGNISCRLSENTLLATPTGVSKGFMDADMLVELDLEGNLLAGNCAPSSEIRMHLRVYRENPALRAVTHAHPPVSTSFAVAGIPLTEPVLSEALMLLGEVPIAPYATSGTNEVPESIAPFVNTHRGVLMANHGVLTWGKDVQESFYLMESIEYYATILFNTKYIIGRANPLTEAQINKLKRDRNNG